LSAHLVAGPTDWATRAVVAVADHGHVVGLGRVVGDDTFYSFIVALMVTPEVQPSGVGRQLLTALEREVAVRTATGVLQLVADERVTPFFVRCGYELTGAEHPAIARTLRARKPAASRLLRTPGTFDSRHVHRLGPTMTWSECGRGEDERHGSK
jgi:GNAT superfamily N-acetyltransferase